MENKELENQIEMRFKENQDRILKKANSFFKKKILTRKRNKNKNFDEIMKTAAFKPIRKYGSFSLNFQEILEIEVNKIIGNIVFDDLIEYDLNIDWYLNTIKPYTDSIIQKIKREYK
jgi:hypothetical protein